MLSGSVLPSDWSIKPGFEKIFQLSRCHLGLDMVIISGNAELAPKMNSSICSFCGSDAKNWDLTKFFCCPGDI